jgi:tetratricopeptide (TPR) repeat protein
MRWRRWSIAVAVLIAGPAIALAPRRAAKPPAPVVAEAPLPPVAPVPLPAPAVTPPAPGTAVARAEAPRGTGRITLSAVDREPKDALKKLSPEELATLRKAVAESPKDRTKRFDLVRALMLSGEREAALAEAKAWREKDAYNLVVVRLLGDLYAEMGEKEKARRAYSAVVELLPGDAEAQRALATVLKQNGDLEGARDRLLAATAGRSDADVRMSFELADVAQRLGRAEEAAERFRAIIDAPATSEAVRYPAKQRLAQIDAAARREAIARGDEAAARRLGEEIKKLDVKGGVENDIKIYLTWDTDRTDVDLWVKTPSGETVNYQHRKGRDGEALFDDVTTGYGPESFTAKKAQPGKYTVEVNYFGTRRQTFSEARGEVVVILGEGSAREEKHVLPYRLFKPKQTVTVAAIEVKP